MRRWPDWSAEGLARVGPLPVVLIGAAVGIGVEATVHDVAGVGQWGPDLVVGMAYVAAGAATLRRPGLCAMFLLTAAAWWLGSLFGPLLQLHRGPLAHLLLAYPGVWPESMAVRVAIAAGYVLSLDGRIWADDAVAAVVVLVLLVLVARPGTMTDGRRQRQRRAAIGAAGLLAIAVVGGALVRTVGSADVVQPMVLIYQLLLAGVAALLVNGIAAPPADIVTDLVVELGGPRSDALRDALARALEDPDLIVGYPTGADGYADADGIAVVLPDVGEGRVCTVVEQAGQPVAVLVHDPYLQDDPTLARAVARATTLSVANAELDARSHEHLLDLEASRRRLLTAGDEERRRLDAELQGGVEAQLTDVARRLSTIPADGEVADHLQRAAKHLDAVRRDLRRLAVGMHPRTLDAGLEVALQDLTSEGAVQAELSVDLGGVDLAPATAATCYFVCAEGLANVAKHARANRTTVSVGRVGDMVRVEVTDDGDGGATLSGGTGLQGLADRVAPHGGRLDLRSAKGGGTRLRAELPLDTRA